MNTLEALFRDACEIGITILMPVGDNEALQFCQALPFDQPPLALVDRMPAAWRESLPFQLDAPHGLIFYLPDCSRALRLEPAEVGTVGMFVLAERVRREGVLIGRRGDK